MITLPDPPKRHLVSAFWIIFAILTGVSAALISVWVRVPGGALGAASLGLLVGVLGAAMPTVQVTVYRVWNKFARRVANLAAGCITRLLFVVVRIAGLGGSRFELGRPVGRSTAWTDKGAVSPDHYESQFRGPGGNRGAWSALLFSWGRRAGRIWTWPLIPLLAVLGTVQSSEKGSFGGNVYTLY